MGQFCVCTACLTGAVRFTLMPLFSRQRVIFTNSTASAREPVVRPKIHNSCMNPLPGDTAVCLSAVQHYLTLQLPEDTVFISCQSFLHG